MRPEDIIRELGMQPHPEGGWYVQTFRDGTGEARGHSTAIYYMLQSGERSHWHRVRDAAEVWHYYAGAPWRSTSRRMAKARRQSSSGQISRAANGHRRSYPPTGGRRRKQPATTRWSAAPSPRALNFRASKWRLRAGSLRTPDAYSAMATSGAGGRRRIILWAASTAPPVTSRQAPAIPQLGSAKPNNVRISVDSNGAA